MSLQLVIDVNYSIESVKKSDIVVPMYYLGPISYYKALFNAKSVVWEACEHFQKATYRNRCYISAANGALRLSIPLVRGKNERMLIKEVRISNDFNWKKLHWESLCSAYRSSPYFEYYEDDLAPIYEKGYDFLWDFNFKIQEFIHKRLDLNVDFITTSLFEKKFTDKLDLRTSRTHQPKIEIDDIKYNQVF